MTQPPIVDGLQIIDNRDNDTITVISKELGINAIIPLTDFARLSVKHLSSGKKMSELIKQWIKERLKE